MRSIALSMLAAIALAGCSLVNPPSDHRGGEIPLERFCPELADLVCQAHLDCCSTPVATYSDCFAAFESDCEENLVPIGMDPRAGYSPDAAARSLAAGRALAERCDTGLVDWISARDGLQGALAGTVVPGGECVAGVSDLSGATLLSCQDLDQACRALVGFPWRCGPRAPVNAECYIDQDCVPEAYCSSVLLTVGQCLPRRGNGDVCMQSEQCQSLICLEGHCAARTVESTYCSISAMM